MANQGEVPNRRPVQHIMARNADVPGHRDRLHHRYHLHLLDAARALMLLGAVAAVSAVGNPDDADGDAAQVLLGFVTWLLGVCLLSFVPVAGRLRQADAFAGVDIANCACAVIVYLFTPWN